MHDKRNRGTVNFEEFTNLYTYIQEWKKCYTAFDRDRSQNIDKNELKTALYNFGYRKVSDNIISLLERKYASKNILILVIIIILYSILILITKISYFYFFI